MDIKYFTQSVMINWLVDSIHHNAVSIVTVEMPGWAKAYCKN